MHGVGVVSSCNAWAVGYRTTGGVKHTLTEHWNGTKWALVTSPSPGPAGESDALNAVTVVSKTSIWAVGTATSPKSPVLVSTLIEHWNGKSWTVVPSPNPGGKFATLIEQWTGKKWVMVPVSFGPFGPTLDYNFIAVAGTSCSNAWAVGQAFVPTPPYNDKRPLALRC